MPLLKHEKDATLPAGLDRFWDFPAFFRRPFVMWPEGAEDVIRVEEFTDDGTLVIKAEMPGIDPDKDVEITLSDHTLHIEAQRREEETTEEKNFVHRELRYGSFARTLPLPAEATLDDVKANYKDGMLEIRIPLPKAETPKATKVPVIKS